MGKHILVIDDDEAVRDAFDLALRSLGVEVETAEDGESGVQRARVARPDLVFLDLRMPGKSGVEVLRDLQALDASIPVYIVTGFYQAYFQELSLAADDGLRFEVASKPLRGEQIREIAKAALDMEGG